LGKEYFRNISNINFLPVDGDIIIHDSQFSSRFASFSSTGSGIGYRSLSKFLNNHPTYYLATDPVTPTVNDFSSVYYFLPIRSFDTLFFVCYFYYYSTTYTPLFFVNMDIGSYNKQRRYVFGIQCDFSNRYIQYLSEPEVFTNIPGVRMYPEEGSWHRLSFSIDLVKLKYKSVSLNLSTHDISSLSIFNEEMSDLFFCLLEAGIRADAAHYVRTHLSDIILSRSII